MNDTIIYFIAGAVLYFLVNYLRSKHLCRRAQAMNFIGKNCESCKHRCDMYKKLDADALVQEENENE